MKYFAIFDKIIATIFEYFEIFLKSVKSTHLKKIVYNIYKSIKYLLVYKNILEY